MDHKLVCGATYGCGNSQTLAHQLGGFENGTIFRKQEAQVGEGEPLKGIGTSDAKRHRVQHAGTDFDQREFSCLGEGTIKMRDINTALRFWGPGTSAFHGERVSATHGQQEDWMRRGTENRFESGKPNVNYSSKNGTYHSWTDFNQADVREIEHVSVDLCQSFRRRKRKQESEKIYRMNCDFRPSLFDTETGLCGGAITEPPEAMELNWVGVIPTHSSEMEVEAMTSAKVHGTEKNKGSARKSARDLSNLTGFRPTDEKRTEHVFSGLVSETTKRTTGSDEYQLARREVAAADVALKIHQGLEGRMGDVPCISFERGRSKDDSMAKLELPYVKQQLENHKLRLEVAALKARLDHLLIFAERGSKKCVYCQLIEENLKHIVVKSVFQSTDELQSSDLHKKSLSACGHSFSAKDIQGCRSPVCSCTNERGLVHNGTLNLHDDDALKGRTWIASEQENSKWTKSDAPFRKDSDSTLEQGSEVEFQLCVDLLPQTEARDRSEDGSAKLGESVIEECHPVTCLGTIQREHDPDRYLRMVESEHGPDDCCVDAIESKQNMLGKLPIKGGRSEKVQDDVKFQEGIKDVPIRETCELSKDTQDADQYFGLFLENHDIARDTNTEGQEDTCFDLKCGCTSQRYGDTVGILRLYKSGLLEIYCQCSSGCGKGKPMTPASFEKHAGRGASKKWRDSVWIVLGGHKVQCSKVKGFDTYYRRYKALNSLRLTQTSGIKQAYHRDEFVRCKNCLKERRFRRRNKEECHLFHDASLNSNWECSNCPPDRSISCQDDEEREVRRAIKGCVRSRTCEGCIECVCLGCFTCRFDDCPCRICQEFMANNK